MKTNEVLQLINYVLLFYNEEDFKYNRFIFKVKNNRIFVYNEYGFICKISKNEIYTDNSFYFINKSVIKKYNNIFNSLYEFINLFDYRYINRQKCSCILKDKDKLVIEDIVLEYDKDNYIIKLNNNIVMDKTSISKEVYNKLINFQKERDKKEDIQACAIIITTTVFIAIALYLENKNISCIILIFILLFYAIWLHFIK